MDLKLNNNRHLTVSTFPDSIKAKITTVYIKDCREITENAFSFLNSIMSLQESVTPKLSRIRVDIGACAGSYSDLMKFSNLQGFDDDYNFQAKPRFVGSYYIDSWHTIEQLNNARSIFESADFTISHDSTKIINFNDVAVQTLDSTKPNYNPAVAIILQARGLGTTLSEPVVNGGGTWFLTKTEAATITAMWTMGGGQYRDFWFQARETVTDSNKLVTDEVIDYDFEEFDELKYFTQITLDKADGVLRGFFYNCKKLKYVTIPDNATVLYYTFWGCVKLERVTGVDHLTSIGTCAFCDCTSLVLNQSDINPNIQDIGPQAFGGCSKITINTIPAQITNIAENNVRMNTFTGTISIPYLHFLSETPITGIRCSYPRTHIYNSFNRTTYKIYVGDGTSAAHDDAILADYQAAANWSGMVSYLDTWYNYLHPQS